MKFDVNQSSKGAWFPYFGSKVEPDGTTTYFPPDNDGNRVLINPPLAPEALEKIYAQTRKMKSEFVANSLTRKMERVTYYEQTPTQAMREFEMIFVQIIGDWELKDSQGAAVPCNDDNKIEFMRNPEFARFVRRCMELLDFSEAERKAELEKN